MARLSGIERLILGKAPLVPEPGELVGLAPPEYVIGLIPEYVFTG